METLSQKISIQYITFYCLAHYAPARHHPAGVKWEAKHPPSLLPATAHAMVMVYPVEIYPELKNNKSLIFTLFRSLARYASHKDNIAFKENAPKSAPSFS